MPGCCNHVAGLLQPGCWVAATWLLGCCNQVSGLLQPSCWVAGTRLLGCCNQAGGLPQPIGEVAAAKWPGCPPPGCRRLLALIVEGQSAARPSSTDSSFLAPSFGSGSPSATCGSCPWGRGGSFHPCCQVAATLTLLPHGLDWINDGSNFAQQEELTRALGGAREAMRDVRGKAPGAGSPRSTGLVQVSADRLREGTLGPGARSF